MPNSLTVDKAPAAKAGIQPGDVIVALGGKALKESKDLQRMVAALPIGKPVDLRIIRDGKEKSVAVTIEDQPDDFGSSRVPAQPAPQREPAAVKLARIGAEVADLTPELAEQLGYRGSVRGVVIVHVEPGGLAATAGLRRGMLITKLERQPATSAAALAQSLDRLSLQNGILFQVESPQGGTAFVLLKENTGR
jgi:serine protease Do